MKKFLLSILLGLMMVSAVGCGTIKGMGEDISTVGKWLAKGSDNVKQNTGK